MKSVAFQGLRPLDPHQGAQSTPWTPDLFHAPFGSGIYHSEYFDTDTNQSFFWIRPCLVYAKIPNRAVLGLFEVMRTRVKVLLYADFKNEMAKIHILTFI